MRSAWGLAGFAFRENSSMLTALLPPVLALVLAAEPATKDEPRKPHPLAPSIPLLTIAEEDKLDDVIDRFMKFDTGQLRGEEGRKAQLEFEKLGPEAIPALIRGLNRAAEMDHSCPALVISTKLRKMLLASNDAQLLEYARDNIGAGVGRSRHGGRLQDLRVACMLRQNALARRSPEIMLRTMSVAELSQAAEKEKGQRLKLVLTELEQRRGPEVLAQLSTVVKNGDKDVRVFAGELMERNLGRQKPEVLKLALKDPDAEIRKATIRVIVSKVPSLGGELIDRLTDLQTDVREAAHEALVKLNKGVDLGPKAEVNGTDLEQAQQRWRTWWEKQSRNR
jgi:hypothetical protein